MTIMENLRISLAQINCLVGDIEGNTKKIIEHTSALQKKEKSDLIIFPELCITGYPPEDLLFRPALYDRIDASLELIKNELQHCNIIIGYPTCEGGVFYNTAAFIKAGHVEAIYNKQCLPNYGVFDEQRYFSAGENPCIVTIKNIRLGLLICEDIWFPEPARQAKKAGADILCCINASPFDCEKMNARTQTLSERAIDVELPILYVNSVGGQDELVFDGGSMAVNEKGMLTYQAPRFTEATPTLIINNKKPYHAINHDLAKPMPIEEAMYNTLVLGTKDYVNKNKFKGAIIGASGGIDSALMLAIAVDALGADRVQAILMPSQYTADMSIEDAKSEAKSLGINYRILAIEETFSAFLNTLAPSFADTAIDTTEENIQARIRGTLLMALSNKWGDIVLTTGNKSEMAVGYSTLYGDMAGGFAALKNIPKTWVYRLAHYRNTIAPVIPERCITRPASAELAPNQQDQDSLPPYDILDDILDLYIEHDQSHTQICQAGFDPDTVKRIIKLVNRNEYKRRQAAPGIRISHRAFGKDRRYPITSGFSGILD